MPSGSIILRHRASADAPVEPAPDCSVHRAWPWPKRLASSAGRRVRAFWRSARHAQQPIAVERAAEWLQRQDPSCGLPTRAGGPPCTGLTAAILPTLLRFGQVELVRGWRDWLLAKQLPDGSFPRADGAASSLFNTAQALHALGELAAADMMADVHAVRRAATFLAGRLNITDSAAGPMFELRIASTLCCLPALAAAARRFEVAEWRQVVDRGVARAQRVVDDRLWNTAMRLVPYVVEAWLELGKLEFARAAMRGLSAAQRRDGSVAADRRAVWGDHAVLAHLASLWFRLGDRRRADRAIVFLTRQQAASGGWSENWGRGCQGLESAWVTKHYLDAVQWQASSHFTADGAGLPLSISCDDGRLLAVEQWLTAFHGSAAKVTDVGCGPGRFLRALVDRHPACRFVGIDAATSLLEQLPEQCQRRRGGLLRLPAADGEFDAAFAVESLEHALLPQRAVDELCRIVRPGGRVLIIDKHAARQPLSRHEPWERWFLPDMIVGWLAMHCRDITCRPISHGPNDEHRGLFLCWEATRRDKERLRCDICTSQR